jgi:hypothetical protein
MIKHFCDRCKKQANITYYVKVPYSYGISQVVIELGDYRQLEFCRDCTLKIIKFVTKVLK